MALSSTVYTVTVDLSNVDRHVYTTLDLKLARHPSETAEYLLTRLLAYALDFVGARAWYGTLAGVHAWAEFPALLLAFTFARALPLVLLVLVASGVALILIMNIANALVQGLVPDALRGRVMSVYSMTFFGCMPIGALWIGAVAEYAGEPAAVLAGAAVGLAVAALLFVLVPRLRRLE